MKGRRRRGRDKLKEDLLVFKKNQQMMMVTKERERERKRSQYLL